MKKIDRFLKYVATFVLMGSSFGSASVLAMVKDQKADNRVKNLNIQNLIVDGYLEINEETGEIITKKTNRELLERAGILQLSGDVTGDTSCGAGSECSECQSPTN